ncbi:MAG: LacI family DNA-binding transcriptional regulator [bacterium]
MNKSEGVSIKDVAEEAGVSPTTVSRVINDSDHPVNEKTREIVEKAIKKLDYQPNRLAQGLKKNKSNIIGVIVHDISDEYFAQLVKGIEAVTFDNDYIVNIINTQRNIHKELKAVTMLKANRAEAIIFTGGNLNNEYYNKKMKDHIKDLKKQGTYILGVTSHPHDIINIKIGNKKAAAIITNYMLKQGRDKIGFVNGPEILSTSEQRLEGYKETLQAAGKKIDSNIILPGDFSFEGGRRAAKKLLDKDISRIEAVIASNDETALGLIWELTQNNINIPGNIAIGGIGDIPASKYTNPPLTTVSLPLYDLGKKLGEKVVNFLKKDKKTGDIKVDIGLVKRESA